MGHRGTKVLAENLRYLLKNPAARKQMGIGSNPELLPEMSFGPYPASSLR
ncbi:hypothetical protein CCACVL1_27997 [Corchorus capsularis]|uniref:Uncharacterized protein n=1 Tax=Corchorus capsularis TaxID=210143 RepID=A0A1R3G7Z5_COCAP|nr:hypothetical protein CCACVL1_27997 [Corchorus capsularis]